MKTILIVEDDCLTRSLLKAGLARAFDCQVLLASNGVEAIQSLKGHEVDLLITDLRMPVMDGFELIAFTAQAYPHLPILVITSMAEAEHREVQGAQGKLQVFHKPLRLSRLLEAIHALFQSNPTQGTVRGLSLTGILQLLEWEQKDATLDVREGSSHGRLHLQQGHLVHAAYQQVAGPAAVRDILGLKNPSISFLSEPHPVTRTIYTPLTELLLNAAIRTDEGSVPA